MLLDCDMQLLRDPSYLFDTPEYRAYGNLFFGDIYSEGMVKDEAYDYVGARARPWCLVSEAALIPARGCCFVPLLFLSGRCVTAPKTPALPPTKLLLAHAVPVTFAKQTPMQRLGRSAPASTAPPPQPSQLPAPPHPGPRR
jgi:hypothetical protein